MCLHNVVEIKNPPKFQIGYKVFVPGNASFDPIQKQQPHKLLPAFRLWTKHRMYSVGTDLHSKKGPGFHFFVNEQKALSFALGDEEVWECRFSGITHEGTQWGLSCRIAQRMKILRKLK